MWGLPDEKRTRVLQLQGARRVIVEAWEAGCVGKETARMLVQEITLEIEEIAKESEIDGVIAGQNGPV